MLVPNKGLMGKKKSHSGPDNTLGDRLINLFDGKEFLYIWVRAINKLKKKKSFEHFEPILVFPIFNMSERNLCVFIHLVTKIF